MTSDGNTLHQMLAEGQSPWIDFITRDLISSGDLADLVKRGIVGMTSNPTIFQKAIGGGAASYEEAMRDLVRGNKSVAEIYDALVLDDIRNAALALQGVYDTSNGRDGFVSIEVSPDMAHDTDRTLAEARRLFSYLNMKNIMIKIPATSEGIPAIKQAIADGINVNVTLIFSLENYRQVAEAYIAGLEERAAADQPINAIQSVASFFVSRVDSAIDKQLDELIKGTSDEAQQSHLHSLQGKAAIANAKLAYAAFEELFSGPRWEALAAKGAQSQRCLWASTSTKNPAYRDILYVEQLIGPATVDTMPPATIDAVLDHGQIARTLDQDVEGARRDLEQLAAAGISMDEVTLTLQKDGVRLFAESFNDLIHTITTKREDMIAHAG